MGRKWMNWRIFFPDVIYMSDHSLKKCSVVRSLCKKACVLFIFYPLSWWVFTGDTEGVSGAMQEWLPVVELRDESRTSILFCQLDCANGNVRAPGKLMNLIGEMPPLPANAWSIAIVFPTRPCFSLFFDCFPHMARLSVVRGLMVNFELRK